MAIYQFTMRVATRMLDDGTECARYQYAYKHGSASGYGGRGGWGNRYANGRVGLKHSAAEDAAFRNRKVRRFVIGDAFAEGQTVHEHLGDGPLPTSFSDGGPLMGGDVRAVGTLQRVGRRLTFVPLAA